MIQEVALELTTSISTMHALTVKYAGIANGILDGLLPIVRNLPIVPKKVLDMLVNLESHHPEDYRQSGRDDQDNQ